MGGMNGMNGMMPMMMPMGAPGRPMAPGPGGVGGNANGHFNPRFMGGGGGPAGMTAQGVMGGIEDGREKRRRTDY